MIYFILRSVSRFKRLDIRTLTHLNTQKMEYNEATNALYSLTSNKKIIDKVKYEIKHGLECKTIEEMFKLLARIDVSENDLRKLSVIHVAGTKGKGSTSALCESILRHHGFKTGFFSSPHLVTVRERIRINGTMIDEEVFAAYFSKIYSKLNLSKQNQEDMPNYFACLTILAIEVFLHENVDVAIFEVGIGGLLDNTNVVNNVPVVGITSLGMDHTDILGNTLEEIAYNKAGIMKQGCEAYTTWQKPNAMDVLKKFAKNIGCNLTTTPDYTQYQFEDNVKPKLKVETDAYKTNISLAIQLSHAWLRRSQSIIGFNYNNKGILKKNGLQANQNSAVILKIPKKTVTGIEKCFWPGRFQIIKTSKINYFLDGAHTVESMAACIEWFAQNSTNQKKCLVFSITGDRDAQTLLKIISSSEFDKAFFIPLKSHQRSTKKHPAEEYNELMKRPKQLAEIWSKYYGESVVHNSVSEFFKSIDSEANENKVDVLVTGSLHLVGALLAVLDPELRNNDL